MTPQARIGVRARQRTIGKRHDRACLHVQRTLAYFGRFERRPPIVRGQTCCCMLMYHLHLSVCPGHVQIRDGETTSFSSLSRGHHWCLDFGWKPLVVSQQSSAPLPSQLYINYKLQSVEHMPSGHQSNYAWGIVEKSTDNWVPPIMQGYHRLSKACQKQPYPLMKTCSVLNIWKTWELHLCLCWFCSIHAFVSLLFQQNL